MTQSQLEATQRQPRAAQSLRKDNVGDLEAPKTEAEPREADAGPKRLAQALEAVLGEFRGTD